MHACIPYLIVRILCFIIALGLCPLWQTNTLINRSLLPFKTERKAVRLLIEYIIIRTAACLAA